MEQPSAGTAVSLPPVADQYVSQPYVPLPSFIPRSLSATGALPEPERFFKH